VAASVLHFAMKAPAVGVGDEKLNAARVVLEGAEARLKTFMADDDLRAIVSREAFLHEGQERQAAVDEARRAVDALLRARSGAPTNFAAEMFETLNEAQINALIRDSLDTVYVRKGPGDLASRLMILWRGEDQYEKPKRGRGSYRTTPIPWPEGRHDEHFLQVPGLVEAYLDSS